MSCAFRLLIALKNTSPSKRYSLMGINYAAKTHNAGLPKIKDAPGTPRHRPLWYIPYSDEIHLL